MIENKASKLFKKILIIAGSDSGGGAGIQADIKTATALKTYSATVITCITAQNTKGVFAIEKVSNKMLKSQIEACLSDISFEAIKIGMLGDSEVIETISNCLNNNLVRDVPIILDPVMVATSGDILLEVSAIEKLKSLLVPKSFLITPNINEAELLSGIKINNLTQMKNSAIIIKNMGVKNVLIKGGHLENKGRKVVNLLLDQYNKFHLVANQRIEIIDSGIKVNFHGTGCSLATAISCNIANGFDLVVSTNKANKYIYKAIKNNLKIGGGSRVLKHF
jgi:hydroxymethylpyrimidine/phosphomethylpyrimidine kinase